MRSVLDRIGFELQVAVQSNRRPKKILVHPDTYNALQAEIGRVPRYVGGVKVTRDSSVRDVHVVTKPGKGWVK